LSTGRSLCFCSCNMHACGDRWLLIQAA
jgi:hypothetical protein